MPATSGAPEPGSSRPGIPPELVPGQRWRRVFPGEERQLSGVRRWLASLLPDGPARDDVVHVACEMANNAIHHTASGRGGWFVVEISWHVTMVQVAVADGGGPTEPRVIEDAADEHGRGLLLVRGLSARAGYCGDRRGRLVWAQVRWDQSGSAARSAVRDSYEAAIRDGETALASQFGSVPAWFGRSTLQWWALSPGGLVTAPSARELAGLLHRLAGTRAGGRSLRAGGARDGAEWRAGSGARLRLAIEVRRRRGWAGILRGLMPYRFHDPWVAASGSR